MAKATVSRLKETFIKTAAKVSVSVRKLLVELASHCPFAYEISLISQRLSSGVQLIFFKSQASLGLLYLNDSFSRFLRL